MATARFSRWDVVAVPFPYTDRPISQRRPALVVSSQRFEMTYGLLWVVMITAAENRRWPDDVEVEDLDAAGLPIPSIVRPSKIATVEVSHARRRGILGPAARRAVETALRRYLT